MYAVPGFNKLQIHLVLYREACRPHFTPPHGYFAEGRLCVQMHPIFDSLCMQVKLDWHLWVIYSINQVPLLMKATSSDEKPTQGYVLQEICSM